MSRRSRTSTDARLDDLLFEPATEIDPAPVGPRRARVISSALAAFFASAVLYVVLLATGLAPPYPLILAVCAAAVAVRRAAGLAGEPGWSPVREVTRGRSVPVGPVAGAADAGSGGGWGSASDGMVDAVRRWEMRLDWASKDRERFDAAVGRRLAGLADEVLRQGYGLTRSADPARARQLLGDHVWQVLAGDQRRTPSPQDVVAVVDVLTRLSSGEIERRSGE
ncbi:MAG TPA: hypothetical protein VF163_00930 [Micromonosporaceae bacterium]